MSAMVGVGDHANRDEGARCLHIAEQALQAGDIAKATRFAEKSMRLYPNDEVMGVRASRMGLCVLQALDNVLWSDY